MPARLRLGRVLALAPGSPTARILIVEDQEENSQLLLHLLQQLGLEVQVVRSKPGS
jgi:CheY-like chemotaxis protein